MIQALSEEDGLEHSSVLVPCCWKIAAITNFMRHSDSTIKDSHSFSSLGFGGVLIFNVLRCNAILCSLFLPLPPPSRRPFCYLHHWFCIQIDHRLATLGLTEWPSESPTKACTNGSVILGYTGICYPIPGLCWAYVAAVLGPCWPMLKPCWGYVGQTVMHITITT